MGDLLDPLVMLPIITTVAAVPDILPNESRKLGPIPCY